MRKRWTLYLILGLIAGLFLSGCAGGPEEDALQHGYGVFIGAGPESMAKMRAYEVVVVDAQYFSDGEIRDPLVIWNGTILDGHNRYRIYKKHPGLRFQTRDVKLSDRNEAIIWICKNQLGRRNLTLEQRRYVIGMLH